MLFKIIFGGLFLIALVIFLISVYKIVIGKRTMKKEEEKALAALKTTVEHRIVPLANQGFSVSRTVYLPEAAVLADTGSRRWCMIRQGKETVSGPYPFEELTQISVREDSRVILQKKKDDPAKEFVLPIPQKNASGGLCQSLRLYVNIEDPRVPTLSTAVISAETERGSELYRMRLERLNEALALFGEIIGR